jgi:hypothetical protein
VQGNAKHAIYSKEYMEVKNCTVNITAAAKDGIHCKEYFLQESGTINISGTADDGIQVEVDNSITKTGQLTDHEDENSGNCYQTGGTLSISKFAGAAIKADGTVKLSGKTSGFSSSDVVENAANGVQAITTPTATAATLYDLNGRLLPATTTRTKGIYLQKNGRQARKVIIN